MGELIERAEELQAQVEAAAKNMPAHIRLLPGVSRLSDVSAETADLLVIMCNRIEELEQCRDR